MSRQSLLLLYALALPLALTLAAISIFLDRHPVYTWFDALAPRQACPQCGRRVSVDRLARQRASAPSRGIPQIAGIPHFDQLVYTASGPSRVECRLCGRLRPA